MPARILPGRVIHCWDHLVITLRDGAGVETGFLSLYAITYSAELGAGHVAIVELPAPAGPMTAILTDDLGLGARQRTRLVAMGDRRAALATTPIQATFQRRPCGADGFGYRIAWGERTLVADWLGPEPPFWVDGEGGAFHPSEDIWSVFIGAPRARLVLDGVAAPGEPFDDDVWRSKLGRSLSSAHAAFAEVRVEPAGQVTPRGRATGTGPA